MTGWGRCSASRDDRVAGNARLSTLWRYNVLGRAGVWTAGGTDGQAKTVSISKGVVSEAYRRVRANKGAAGVDGESLVEFERDLKGNLYKLWNRISSGATFRPRCAR
jgi:hypothetical protein